MAEGSGSYGRGENEPVAALDLGTNNCRLLIAAPARGGGFRVVDSFSRIVRLGEGMSTSGRLSQEAMDRAVGALMVCAERIGRRGVRRVRAVATQACRAASNGDAFVQRVRRETGLRLEVIGPAEEARLASAGCHDLLEPTDHDSALVLDVGGGSTELSWLDLRHHGADGGPRLAGWTSLPLGVVDLAERFPEATGEASQAYAAMLAHVRAVVAAAGDPAGCHARFAAGRGQVIGVSGAVTSLAALHMRLPRYRRDRVDGAWVTTTECDDATRRLMGMSVSQRGAEPCIGPDRADLVLAGAAILRGVVDHWPTQRVRVADRGLREGLLLELLAQPASRTRLESAAVAL